MSSRANLSDNWRVKSDNQAVDASTRQPPRSARQRPSNLNSRPTNVLPKAASNTLNTIRGEDDPRTLQAIADGRRVYVGNMPYMAKPEDVKGLFANGDYSMSASLYGCYFCLLTRLLKANISICPLIRLLDVILPTVSSSYKLKSRLNGRYMNWMAENWWDVQRR